MKKGDRIRCKRACGELPKGAEGICEIPPGETTGQGKFMGGTYGISLEYFEVIATDETSATLNAVYSDSHAKTQKLDRFLVFAWDEGRAKGGANDLVFDTPKYELAMNHVSTHHDCVQIVDSELGITLYQKVKL